MFKSDAELIQYVKENYPEITDDRIDDDHWDLLCPHCKITRGFQLIKRNAIGSYSTVYSSRTFVIEFKAPFSYVFRCPVCGGFKQWIIFELHKQGNVSQYFRVTSIPSDGLEDIEELPEEPRALRTAYKQAIRAMDANAPLAAAAMFRRALQVITREVLGVKPGNLADELKAAVGKSINGTVVQSSFEHIGYIVKEAGNQGAHPDKDPDLLDFTLQDAEDLQQVFMEIVSELFIVPAAAQKAKAEFLNRRKIIPKSEV